MQIATFSDSEARVEHVDAHVWLSPGCVSFYWLTLFPTVVQDGGGEDDKEQASAMIQSAAHASREKISGAEPVQEALPELKIPTCDPPGPIRGLPAPFLQLSAVVLLLLTAQIIRASIMGV